MFDVQKLMKQAQQMQKDIELVQNDLSKEEVTGSAGGGAVTVICDGRGEIKSIKLTEEAMQDREVLEEMLLSAVKDTVGRASEAAQAKMGKVTQGMNIPGFLK